MDPRKIEFRNVKREIVFLPDGRLIEPRLSAYGICVVEKRVLLVQSAFNGLWEAPGGRADPGESPLEAMRREFSEETGFEVPDQNFLSLGVHQEYFHDEHDDQYFDSSMHFFQFRGLGKRLTTELDPLEVNALDWFSQEALESLPLHPVSKKFIALSWRE
jgi:8-oxo-dGTP pyrophosphatase MutT (NUDIX family)